MTTKVDFIECECLEAFRLISQINEIVMDEEEGVVILRNAMKLSKLSGEPVGLYRRKGYDRLSASLDDLDLESYRYIGLLNWLGEEDYKFIMQN